MDLKSGYPLWPVANGLIRTYPHLAADARCDVAILGAGITGALVADHLTRAGLDVLLLDRRDVGWGSTAASTAILQYELDLPLVELTKKVGAVHASAAYRACVDAVLALGALADQLGVDVGFERKQSLYLAARKRDRTLLAAEVDARQAIGIRCEYLDESDLGARFPFRRPAAILSHDAAQVDAYAFAHALLARSGARVFDRTNVARIDASDDGVTLTTDEGHTVRARHLVFASGYETREWLKQRVARLVSTYALATEPLDGRSPWGEDACLIWEHRSPYLYLRTTPDGRIIVGGEDVPFKDARRRDRLLAKKTERLVARAQELLPDVDLRVAFSWTGTFGETDDALPYIGQHPDWPSSWFALGYGGNGITFSLLAAEIIRDALTGVPNDRAALFRFDR